MARKKAEPGTGGQAAPANGETARDETIGAIPEAPPEPVLDADSAAAPSSLETPGALDLPKGPERHPWDPVEPSVASDPAAPAEAAPLAASARGADPWGAGGIDPARVPGGDGPPDPFPADPLTGGGPYGEPPHADPLTGGPLDPVARTADPLEPDPAGARALDAERDPLDPPPTEPVEPADPWVHAQDPAVETPPVPPGGPRGVVEDEAIEGDRDWSPAAKALAALALLSLGAVAGLWAAPRIAPHLPAGMAPVAAWLTPGATEAEARVAEIRGEVAALQARVADLPTAEALRGEAQSLVGQTRDSLAADIAALRDQIGQGGAPAPAQRFGQIESTLSGIGAELAALKGQIEGGAPAPGTGAVAGLDTYRAELDGLRAEVGRLSGEVGALTGRLDEAETSAAEAEAEAAALVDVAAARADLAQIRAALVSGAPFQAELDRFARNAGAAIPAGLSAAAAAGVATEAELEAGFPEAAHAGIRTSIVASAGDGFWNRARAFVEARVAGRALAPQEGSSPDAVLSRVEAALKRNDLATALREVGTLPTEARAAMDDWIARARLRADAEAGLAELSAAPNMN